MRKARAEAGLPEWVTPYTFRHTTASLLAHSGVGPHVAAKMLGNDPAVYLRTYAHLYPEDLRSAACALDGLRTTEGDADVNPTLHSEADLVAVGCTKCGENAGIPTDSSPESTVTGC